MDATKFQEAASGCGLTCEAQPEGDAVILSKGETNLLRVDVVEGVAHFTSLADDPVTGNHAGQALNPSDQKDAHLHASTCARDMAEHLGLKDKEPESEPKAPKAKAELKAEPEAQGYDAMHVDELHKLATEREIEGRSELTTKAQLVKALEKDDKAKAKAGK